MNSPSASGDERWLRSSPSAMWPTPFSFAHSFIRYAGEQAMSMRRTHWRLDKTGRGTAAYQVQLGGRTFSWVAASFMLDPDEQEDRIVATKWDSTSMLAEGEVIDADFLTVLEQVTNVLWGRARPGTLVWSRGNRSVRLFEHTTQALARGEQPDPARFAAIGYLFRTTGFSANGRNGMVDYAALVEENHPLRGSYHAQMLASYLWREFSIDLVEHMARQINPEAASLSPSLRRYLGVGNSSGVGLAPFIVRHPVLINQWTESSNNALKAVADLDVTSLLPSGFRLADDLNTRLDDAVQHFREQPTAEFERFASGYVIAGDLRAAQRLLVRRATEGSSVREYMTLLRPLIHSESLEAVKSVLLESASYGVETDRLDAMTAEETLNFEGSMQCGVLRALLHENFSESLRDIAASRSEDKNYYFWYYSEENSEPRRGEAGEDPGEEYSIPLDMKGRLQQLDWALSEISPQLPVAHLTLEQPDLHYIVSWVQSMIGRPNVLAATDFLSRDFLPVDTLRFQLAIYGMLKMRTTSPNRLRGTILQGAPLPDELGTRAMPLFPVAPAPAGRADV